MPQPRSDLVPTGARQVHHNFELAEQTFSTATLQMPQALNLFALALGRESVDVFLSISRPVRLCQERGLLLATFFESLTSKNSRMDRAIASAL